ncbi:MAG: hypothetical protein AAB075_02800, partial [Gemmatimonadota bacterium]
MRLLTPAEDQQLLDQFLSPGRRPDDFKEVVARLRFVLQGARQQVGVSDYRGEQVVEVVRDSARQTADRLHPLCMSQESLGFHFLVQGLLAVRD